MALRERLLIASGLLLGLSAVGCGDGDSTDTDGGTGTMDSGPKDGSIDSGKDSGKDSSTDTGGDELPTIPCGSNTCSANIVNGTLIEACCVPDSAKVPTSQCGLNADDLRRANPSSPFTGCIPRDVMAASASTYCGEFWDQVEMEKVANGGLDIKSGSARLTFDGCCLPSGECGAQIDVARGVGEDLNSHLGCVSFSRFQAAFEAAGVDSGTGTEQPAKLPYCNPANGAPLMGADAKVPGQPKFVCGCGAGKIDDHKGTFPCFNNLDTSTCGAADPTAEQLAMVPEFICGCDVATPSNNKLPCLINVDKATCGTLQIDKDSPQLAAVPSFICGEDPTSPLPTLKGVDKSVCGKAPPTAGQLADVPEFICGCTAGSKLPCLRNSEATVCGGKEITTGSPFITEIPEYICGCGADKVDTNASIPCLSHVEQTVCGPKEVTEAPALTDIPKLLCGCGDGKIAERCLPNVPANLCGAADATSSLASLPSFLCGCGENVLAGGRPCLNNLPTSTCGAAPVPSNMVTFLPKSLCGCGAGVTYDPSNVAFTSPCLSKIAKTECGGGDIPTSDPKGTPENPADDCFTGIKAYARGCGLNTTGDTCVPNGANTMFGCDQPADGLVVPGQPAFACGCGVGVIATNCIPNVGTNVCGAVAVSTGSPFLSTIPVFVCGAVGAAPSLLPSLRNVDKTVCGTKPITQTSAELDDVPAFICGEQGNPETSLPTLRNLPLTVCGEKTPSAAVLLNIPEFLCGCQNEPVPQARCLRNLDVAVCGTKETVVNTKGTPETTDDCLTDVPEYARGCGADASPAASPASARSCLRHAEQFFGCVDTAVDTKGTATAVDDCLVGVPEYLLGCGETAFTGTPNCLPFAAPTLGCVDVTLPQRAVFEHICGCGNNPTDIAQAFPAYPCLSRVATTICGTIPVTVSQLAAGVPNTVCGCGDNDSTSSGCVKNAPASVCGAVATCSAGTCAGTCQDTNSDGILNFCQP